MPPSVQVKHEYQPLPAQQMAHEVPARYVVFGGSVGPGKSRFLVEHAFAKMIRWPGIPVFCGREHERDIALTTELTWQRSIDNALWDDPKLGGRKQGRKYTFGNGSSIHFMGFKDWESLMSAEVGLLEFEELSEIQQAAWTNLDSRLRWIPPGDAPCKSKSCTLEERHGEHPFYQEVGVTNPTGGWVKKEFYDKWVKGTLPPNYAFIQSQTADNPYLPPTYLDDLLKKSGDNPAWVQRMVKGDWTAFEGQIFRNYDESIHLWRQTEPFHPDAVEYVGSLDVGATTQYAHRTVGLVAAILRNGDILVFAEYSQQGPASAGFELWHSEMTQRWGIRRWRGSPEADRYLRMLGQGSGTLVRPAIKRGGSRVERTNRTFNQFAIDPVTSRPKLYIHEDCRHLRLGIQGYSQIPEGVALQGVARPSDDAMRRDDDEVDALGYLLEEIATTHHVNESSGIVVANTAASPWENGSSIMARRAEMRHKRLKSLIEAWGDD